MKKFTKIFLSIVSVILAVLVVLIILLDIIMLFFYYHLDSPKEFEFLLILLFALFLLGVRKFALYLRGKLVTDY